MEPRTLAFKIKPRGKIEAMTYHKLSNVKMYAKLRLFVSTSNGKHGGKNLDISR